MALQIWTGNGRFRTTHENRACTELISQLKSMFESGDQLVIAVFNLNCTHELDLLILKRDAIAIVDFKWFQNEFHATVKGPWKGLDGQCVRAGAYYPNPFVQVSHYRHDFLKFLDSNKTTFLSHADQNFHRAAAVVAVWPTLPSVTSDIDPVKYPWFSLVGLDQLPRLIADFAHRFFLSDEELSSLIGKQLQCVPFNKLHKAKVFICHSQADRQMAEALISSLGPWPILEIVAPSPELVNWERAYHDIEEADHVVCLISENSWGDQYVSRVLGLASSLRHSRNTVYPSVFGILCEREWSELEFPTESWPGSAPNQSIVDFGRHDRYHLDGDPSLLADALSAKVTFFDGSQLNSPLLQQSFAAYEELFPDDSETGRNTERDDPEDILTWLAESYSSADTGDPWREFFAVLHAAENVIGMAYLSGHKMREWLFGNYFGVRRPWRQDERADAFLFELSTHVRNSLQRTRGIIFEIDSVDLNFLRGVASRPTLGGHADHRKVVANLRAARRIRFYQHYRCFTVLGADAKPLPYCHPAMSEPLDETGEREQILMLYLFDHEEKEKLVQNRLSQSLTVQTVLDFLYDDVYGDAYGDLATTTIPGYDAYLTGLKNKVTSCKDAALGYWRMKTDDKKLLSRLLTSAKREGWLNEIAL